ncbi:MAG: TadE family protein [Bdellovibrionota bacterium]
MELKRQESSRRAVARGPCDCLRSEAATALLEFAIALPFLMTLVFGVIDLERGLRQHYILQAAVQQTLPQAMAMALLPSGAQYSNKGTAACPGGYDAMHAQLHQQVADLVVAQDSKLTDVCIQSQLTISPGDNKLRLKASAPLKGVCMFFDGITISAELEVPYLLNL